MYLYPNDLKIFNFIVNKSIYVFPTREIKDHNFMIHNFMIHNQSFDLRIFAFTDHKRKPKYINKYYQERIIFILESYCFLRESNSTNIRNKNGKQFIERNR